MSSTVAIETLNNLIDNKDNFYYALISKGYYLPKISSRAISFD